MALGPRPRLPTELLHMVCSLVTRKSDLLALARADKTCNEICTPLLYRTIIISGCHLTQKCVETLASDPSRLFLGRDLASFVHTFLIERCCRESEPYGVHRDFDNLLLQSVRRMPNLRAFQYPEIRLRAVELLGQILSNSPRKLRLLHMPLIYLPEAFPDIALQERVFEQLVITPPAITQLSELSLYFPDKLPQPMVTVLRGLLLSSARTMTRLRITSYAPHETMEAIIPPLRTFPALKDFDIQAEYLAAIPALGHHSKLRSIRVYNSVSSEQSHFALPSISWPELEELECELEVVSLFLPYSRNSDHRRPISTLRLCGTKYTREGGHNWCNDCLAPSWDDNLRAINSVWYSAVPLKHLSFSVEKLKPRHIKWLPRYIQQLETLVIAVSKSPLPDDVFALGQVLIARLPRLHTFLLADVALKRYSSNHAFRFARDVGLQRHWLAEFETHSSVLRRVAFTTEFEWERGADGTWRTSNPPRCGPVEWSDRAYDEEDTDSSDDEESEDGYDVDDAEEGEDYDEEDADGEDGTDADDEEEDEAEEDDDAEEE
ncbi:hypothetical protein C8Q77DRAFT_1161932 [Trametes polyzona]|nr:hypothetical protein C8Q77DRAFT_1161932 [Trametes polyzona]